MVMIFQLPNILNFRARTRFPPAGLLEARTKLDQRLASREIDRDEYQRQIAQLRKKYTFPQPDSGGSALQEIETRARTANLYIPAGWLPYGAVTLLEGRATPAIFATAGLALIGTVSLARSYKTTLRLYTGQFKAKKPRRAAVAIQKLDVEPKSAGFLEKQLPWLSDQASAITLACMRSLIRAPEAKMMLLTPVIFTLVFGSAFLRAHSDPPQIIRPVMAALIVGFILLGMAQLAGNQFGFDRNGFRVFVLSGASRRDILLGKNLALMPFALGLGMIAIILLQVAYPMRIDHWIAAAVQMISMYLVYCVINNFMSIFAPTAIAFGSLRPMRPKGMAMLIQIVFAFILMPIALGLSLIPLGIEYFFPSLPVYLLLTLVSLATVAYFYFYVLDIQGRILHQREQEILLTVAAKVE
jgi:hypothetical protein